MRLAFAMAASGLFTAACVPVPPKPPVAPTVYTWNTTQAERDLMRARGKPVRLVAAQPAYPREWVNRRVEGCVLVGGVIQQDGRVADLRIEKAIPAGLLEGVALDAARQWVFEPQAEPIKVIQPMAFGVAPRQTGTHINDPEMDKRLIAPCLAWLAEEKP